MAIYCLEDDANIRELMTYTLDLGGSIRVESVENAGSTFTVTLQKA